MIAGETCLMRKSITMLAITLSLSLGACKREADNALPSQDPAEAAAEQARQAAEQARLAAEMA